MRLSSLSPEVIPTTLVDALRTLGIVSEADLFFSATVPEFWRKLPPDLVPLSELERCVKAVMNRCAVPRFPATGADERPLSDESKPEIPTGLSDLDNLLGTTLQDSVIEVSGRHGSGAAVRSSLFETFLFATQISALTVLKISKTLALQIACNRLSLDQKTTVLWIDTTGDFSPARADTILRSAEPREVCTTKRNAWAVAVLFNDS